MTKKEVHAMCNPSLFSVVATYGRNADQYIAAMLDNMDGKAYLDRILISEARVETSQYKYDLTTHLANPIDMDISQNDKDGNALEDWEHVKNAFATVTVIASLKESGLVTSQQVLFKFKALSALSTSPNINQQGKNTTTNL
eukprot:15365511-Ditylum_brightwellii.AAC.3